jgi:hypothetical protein
MTEDPVHNLQYCLDFPAACLMRRRVKKIVEIFNPGLNWDLPGQLDRIENIANDVATNKRMFEKPPLTKGVTSPAPPSPRGRTGFSNIL